MRNHPLPTIPRPSLIAVTGGSHKGCQPHQQAQAQAQDSGGPNVSVTVGTGQAGGQAIQQALSGGVGGTTTTG
ncbi:MAG TPA: hypothetical protein VF403_26195 [Kofleriaceae bacterium]